MSIRRGLPLLVLLAACGVPRAAAQEVPPTDEVEARVEAEGEVETQSGGGYTTTTHAATTTTQAATTTTLAAVTTTTAVVNPQGPTTTTTQPAVTTTTQGVTTTTAGATTTTQRPTTTTEAPKKVFVCKYVGKPGVDERLQTGDNPISVSVNAIPLDNVQIGSEFADAQGRSVVIAFDTGQPEPGVGDCPPPIVGTTTTTSSPTTTTQPGGTTTTTQPGGTTTTTSTTPGGTTTTTSTPPTGGLFAIEVEPTCPDGTLATIEITFGNRPDLNGQVGTLTFSTGGSIPLTFIANTTVEVPYPTSAAGGPVTMTYTLGAESVTRSTTFPEACALPTTTTAPGGTTTTTLPGGTTTTTSPTPNTFVTPTTTTLPGVTTTTLPGATTTTTLPPALPFSFGAAATVCVAEVPTIRITFVSPAQFPTLVGQTGTLTMRDVNGNVVSTQPLVYAPGTTVDILYPGTRVNPDGSVADVPGWTLTSAGLWVRDPSDTFLREGINLTYTVNPTATAFVTYPPESANCANPDGPFPPTLRQPPPPGGPFTPSAPPAPPAPGQPGGPGLPTTGSDRGLIPVALLLTLGGVCFVIASRPQRKV
jgi:hypothetical protein